MWAAACVVDQSAGCRLQEYVSLCGMGFVVSRYVYSWQKCELLAGLCIVYRSVSLLADVCVDSQQDSVSHGNGEVVSVLNLVIIEVWG